MNGAQPCASCEEHWSEDGEQQKGAGEEGELGDRASGLASHLQDSHEDNDHGEPDEDGGDDSGIVPGRVRLLAKVAGERNEEEAGEKSDCEAGHGEDDEAAVDDGELFETGECQSAEPA